MAEHIFGHIPGYPVGSAFTSRSKLSQASLHSPTRAGIAGSAQEGATSIVLSGGYEDDEDWGDEILYTGQGGRDLNSGRQVRHQALNRTTLALAKNKLHGLPVRVIRGARHVSPYSPKSGYRYDGLYRVEDYWLAGGKSGYDVWRFLLRKIPEKTPKDAAQPMTLRIVRDTEQTRQIKALYNYRCQVCGIRLEGSAGLYAEAVHIRPLGKPHNGSDSPDNILCLCPNHHVLFEYGGFTIADDWSLVGVSGSLHVHPRHTINLDNIRYHQEHYFYDPEE